MKYIALLLSALYLTGCTTTKVTVVTTVVKVQTKKDGTWDNEIPEPMIPQFLKKDLEELDLAPNKEEAPEKKEEGSY